MSEEKKDQYLDMGREITRRDFLNGVAIDQAWRAVGELLHG